MPGFRPEPRLEAGGGHFHRHLRRMVLTWPVSKHVYKPITLALMFDYTCLYIQAQKQLAVNRLRKKNFIDKTREDRRNADSVPL